MWLPFLSVHFPGCGITPFNIDDLSLWWWRIYRARAIELADALKRQEQVNKTKRK